MMRRRVLLLVLMISVSITVTAQACGRTADSDTDGLRGGLYGADGEPAVCYFCGRNHAEVYEVYLAAIREINEASRVDIVDRYDESFSRYEDERRAWEELVENANSLPDIVMRMRYSTARSEMNRPGFPGDCFMRVQPPRLKLPPHHSRLARTLPAGCSQLAQAAVCC